MYKRLILVLIILFLCISISIGSYLSISYMSEDLTADLNSFILYVKNGNNTQAVVTITKCIEKLEAYEKAYAVFLDHNLFEDIMITIPSIKSLYETGNYDEALDKCFESIQVLNIIVSEQKPVIENIF